jgi:hypothetical protein
MHRHYAKVGLRSALVYQQSSNRLRAAFAVAIFAGTLCTADAVTGISNLNQAFSTTHTVGYSSGTGTIFADAISFTTGATATNLDSIRLYGSGGGAIANFSVSLYSGISNPTGPSGLVTATSGPAIPTLLAFYDYTPIGATLLQASTTYWLVVSAFSTPTNTFFAWRATASTSDDGGLSGWSVGDLRWATLNNGSTWSGLGGVIPQFSIQVTPIPETSWCAPIIAGVVLGYTCCRRRRQ